jgi:hypothetical protein
VIEDGSFDIPLVALKKSPSLIPFAVHATARTITPFLHARRSPMQNYSTIDALNAPVEGIDVALQDFLEKARRIPSKKNRLAGSRNVTLGTMKRMGKWFFGGVLQNGCMVPLTRRLCTAKKNEEEGQSQGSPYIE